MRYPLPTRAGPVVATLILVLMAIQPARAEQDRILGDVTIVMSSGSYNIHIGFDVPILYLRHFPYESGETLLVFVQPLGISPGDRETAFHSETASIPPNECTGLSDILFEGDAPGDPYLSITFTRRVSFDARQGRDYRSIEVDVYLPVTEASELCSPRQ